MFFNKYDSNPIAAIVEGLIELVLVIMIWVFMINPLLGLFSGVEYNETGEISQINGGVTTIDWSDQYGKHEHSFYLSELGKDQLLAREGDDVKILINIPSIMDISAYNPSTGKRKSEIKIVALDINFLTRWWRQ